MVLSGRLMGTAVIGYSAPKPAPPATAEQLRLSQNRGSDSISRLQQYVYISTAQSKNEFRLSSTSPKPTPSDQS